MKRYDMLGKRVAGSIPTRGRFRVGFTQVGKRSIIPPEAGNDHMETCHMGRDTFRVQGEKTRQIH